jgi:hypothetical protein
MYEYVGMKVLDGGERPTSRQCQITSQERVHATHPIGGWVDLQSRTGRGAQRRVVPSHSSRSLVTILTYPD